MLTAYLGGQEEYARLRPLSYPDTSFVLMMFCLESEETLDNCIATWAPEVTHFCPGVPIILVGVFHCYRSDYDDDKQSERAVTDECATAAAKAIGEEISIIDHLNISCSPQYIDSQTEAKSV